VAEITLFYGILYVGQIVFFFNSGAYS